MTAKPTWLDIAKATAGLPVLFATCYLPAMGLLSLIASPDWKSVFALIFISSLIAFTLILLLRKFMSWRWIDFGFNRIELKRTTLVYVSSLLFALPLVWWISLGNPKQPQFISEMSVLQKFLAFVVLASIQEELIFRGLLQGFFHRVSRLATFWPSILIVALIFGVIHLGAGERTAMIAFVLGAVAGFLRFQKNYGLFSAIACHSGFNLASLFMQIAQSSD